MSAPRFVNRARQTSVTTGTGSYQLDTSVPLNFRNYVAAGVAVVWYFAVDTAGNGWEEGWGLVTDAATDTLTRNVTDSSNGGAAVDWPSGTRTIFTAPSASAFNALLDAPAHPLLVNGNFAIKRRLATSIADDSYGHDGWNALTESGNVTIATLTDVEDGLPFMARLTQPDVSAKRIGYAQIIEGKRCKHLRGRKVTFRFDRFRCTNSQAIRFALLEWTGTEDTVTSDVVNNWASGTYTAGNFFLGANLTVSGVTSKTPASNTIEDGPALTVTMGSSFNNLIVLAWTEGTLAQNFNLDLGKAQLDVAPAPLPFVHPPYEADLRLCERYLPIFSPAASVGISLGRANSTTSAVFPFTFRTAPRVKPTGFSFSSAAHFQLSDGTNTWTPTNLTGGGFSEHGGFITATVASGLTALTMLTLLTQSASGEFMFTGCEL